MEFVRGWKRKVMEFYFLLPRDTLISNADNAQKRAYAVGIKEGGRWKFFAINPATATQDTDGDWRFENVRKFKIKGMDYDTMFNLYHDMIEKHGFLEVDYGTVKEPTE